MTKQEYIKSRCEACGLCDGSEYHQYHCPDVDEIDSAWEICQKEMIDKACEWWDERTSENDKQFVKDFRKAMEE